MIKLGQSKNSQRILKMTHEVFHNIQNSSGAESANGDIRNFFKKEWYIYFDAI